MDTNLKILGVGTMRTGGSLINNALSVHSKIVMLGERTHYFRFVHEKYDPLDAENVERLLHHMRIRLRHRFRTPFDADQVFRNVLAREVSYPVCYDEIMKHVARSSGKSFWGDYAPAGWRQIPFFLNAFPGGKAWHICRDPRGVLASWRKLTFQGDSLYLNFIFNWIDSVNYIRRLRSWLPSDRYWVVRFEDIHRQPLETMQSLCKFLGVEFEEPLVRSEKWEAMFDSNLMEANISSHTGKRVYGYDTSRIERWRENIDDWEIALVEFLAGEQMDYMGYERLAKNVDVVAVRHGIDLMRKHPLMLKNLQTLLATGEGTPEGINDPTTPENWGVPDGSGRFVDTPQYAEYMREREDLEQMLARKYAGKA